MNYNTIFTAMKRTVRFTIKEYAKKIGCTPSNVQVMIHKKKLVVEKYGRTYVIIDKV